MRRSTCAGSARGLPDIKKAGVLFGLRQIGSAAVSLTPLICFAACLFVHVPVSLAGGFEMEFERDCVPLNGEWQYLIEHGDQEVWKPKVAEALGPWKTFLVPGKVMTEIPNKEQAPVRFVWARRRFDIPLKDAAGQAVLKWNGVRFGATAWINGQQVTTHAPIGPHTAMIPSGIILQGKNQIVLKIPGWSGLPRGQAGFPLIPTGSGPTSWGNKSTGIYDDIWIEFYDRAYVSRALAIPDIEAGTVTFRLGLETEDELPDSFQLSARVFSQDEKTLLSEGAAQISGGEGTAEIAVPLTDVKPWTPETPHLYVAEIRAGSNGVSCDRVRFRFGMREIEVVDGHYRLNSKPLWFRGSNLVCEWLWEDAFNKEVKRYIVDEARNMNLNSFRTHTLPPPASWLKVADEHGTMILAEFPVLYNYINPNFTPEERGMFRKNVLLDATGWITKLWNHPSVVMWVLSNESGDVDEARWEAGPYWEHVKALDPTRPTMRTALPRGGALVGTKENLDIHTCGNYARHPEGWPIPVFAKHAAEKDPQRTLTNSEYMNGGPWKFAALWVGRRDHPYADLSYAEFAMEHTEAMRRYNFDGILPYMYAGWPRFRGNNWRQDYPTPMAAALQSSMAPVLASLDLFDRNFVAGEEIETRLVLINERLRDVKAVLDVYVTPQDPLFVPDAAALEAAVSKQSFDLALKPCSMDEMTLRWQVPEEEGIYYLAAVLREEGERPVVSQRVVRAIKIDELLSASRMDDLVLLGGDDAAEAWLRGKHIPFVTSVSDEGAVARTVLIWNAKALPESDGAAAPAILENVRNGGRLIILNQPTWTWGELVDFEIQSSSERQAAVNSRVFPYEGASHQMLDGVDPEYLQRWNGLPGTISDSVIEGDAVERGTKLLWAWAGNEKKPVALAVPEGKGEIVICLLHLKSHVTKDAPSYDPVADRILTNLLTRRK